MREIKAFGPEIIDEYTTLAYNTYPSFKDYSEEGINEFKELVLIRMNDSNTQYYGMFDNGELIGAVRYIEFDMNLYNKMIRSAGIASLAVKLNHKKQRIAKELIDFLEDLMLERNIVVSMLLPFRLDFYKKMGYGFGTKMNRYRFNPINLPKDTQESKIKLIERDDLGGVFACYNKYMNKTHGMLNKMDEEIFEYETNPQNLIVANYEN
ncbi:MAG: GNAT family N-acetyltransferase, partial [Erysipelotrichales bacterium]